MTQSKKHSKKDLYNVLLISFLVLLLTLPFINKPFHIDDNVFIYQARHLIKEPLDPYSFDLSPVRQGMTFISDPPLISYYIAVIIYLFGESEWILHLSYVLFSLLIGILTYFISKKFVRKSLYPALFLVASTAFIISSHSVMLDIPFLAFFLLSVAFFIHGIDSNKSHLIFFGALFCGLAYLIKYIGLIIIPILALYALYKKKFKPLLYLIIPIITIVLWNYYTFKIYGAIHNIEILGWLFHSQTPFSPNSIILKLITNSTYLGGATLFPLMLIYPFIIKTKNRLVYFLIIMLAIITSIVLYFISSTFAYRYTIPQLLLFAFFLSTGLFFLFVIIRYYSHIIQKLFKIKNIKNIFNDNNYINNLFLVSWFLITFLFITVVAGGAVRYITLIMPPMMIMYFKIFEDYRIINAIYLRHFIFLGLLLTSALSISVAYADYVFADAYRDFSKTASVYKSNDNRIWFSGQLGFKYYMEKKGYTELSSKDNSPNKGDVIIKAQIPTPRGFSPLLIERMILIDAQSYKSIWPIRVQNPESRAGFYTYGGGFLPYSISKNSLENFEIYMVVK